MSFPMSFNVLFRTFRLLTTQVGSDFAITCTNLLDSYK